MNHGNVVPSISEVDRKTGLPLAGGVTIDRAEHCVVLSLAALRKLRFPLEGKPYDARDPEQHARDDAARAVLAALGLLATELATRGGMDLRSRCLLWNEGGTDPWSLLDGRGSTELEPEIDSLFELFEAAVAAARKVGLPWRTEPLTLTPSASLVKLTVKSQRLAAASAGDDGGADS